LIAARDGGYRFAMAIGLNDGRNDPTQHDHKRLPDGDAGNRQAGGEEPVLDRRRAFRYAQDGAIHSSISQDQDLPSPISGAR